MEVAVPEDVITKILAAVVQAMELKERMVEETAVLVPIAWATFMVMRLSISCSLDRVEEALAAVAVTAARAAERLLFSPIS
jgi:hypothetical protein